MYRKIDDTVKLIETYSPYCEIILRVYLNDCNFLHALSFQCTPTLSSQFPLYTWTVDRQVTGGSWRPELSVCVSASSSDATLVIPSNTLWYGTYRINVTVSASTDGSILHLPASLDRSAPSTTYLTVVPTPLVANVTVIGDSTEFYSNATVSLDMSSSGDPDVTTGNTTGYKMYVFCYPQQNQSAYGAMSLNQKLASATNISSNRCISVRAGLIFDNCGV